ncbi:MAG: chemotaxis protein CheD [Campylobacterales bacterium]
MYEKKFINVGEIYVAKKPTEIVTILGSCVAVCLYDTTNKIGAMNHYLVPLWNGNGLASPKYGDVSVEKLVKHMFDQGCKPYNIIAKIFGGSNINIKSAEGMLIGKKNVIIAKEILAKHKIKIQAEDTGGNRGRRIMLVSDTGKIMLKYTGSALKE